MTPQHGHGNGATDGIHVSAFGLVIHLQFDDQLDEQLREQVIQAWSGATVGASEHAATLNVVAIGSCEQTMETLSTQVTLAALEASQGELLTFHAAGIALDDGRVIAFVGPSGRGKTTLVRTLGKHYGYVSDETIAVDAALGVRPYRKPLSVVQHQLPKRQIAPQEDGLLELPVVPLRLAGLVLLDRDPNATEVTIQRVPLLQAMAELVMEMSYTASLDAPLQQLATLCERVGGVQRITYRDVSGLPAAIDQLLHLPVLDECWTPAMEVVCGVHSFKLANISDAISCSGELAVFNDQTLRILAGIAPVVWEAVRAGKQFDEIVEAVVEEHGMPDQGDPSTLVNSAIDVLLAEGLLCRAD